MFTSTFLTVLVHERIPRTGPLSDIVLLMINKVPWAFRYTELIITFQFCCLLLFFLFRQHRAVFFRRYFVMASLLYLARQILMWVTALPAPDKESKCEPVILPDWPSKVYKAAWVYSGAGMTINNVETCGDYLFSGHTILLVLFTFFLHEVTPDRPRWRCFVVANYVLCGVGMALIVVSHEHYSIDVIVGWWISSAVWCHYHQIAIEPHLKPGTAEHHYQSVGDRVFRWWVLWWEEEDLGAPVPNIYETPWAGCRRIYADYLRTCAAGSPAVAPLRTS